MNVAMSWRLISPNSFALNAFYERQ